MLLHYSKLDIPDGYALCPLPREWSRNRNGEKILLQFKCSPGGTFTGTISDVLTKLDDLIIPWKTSYSSVKGTTEFAIGLFNDRFYIEPNHNPKQETCCVSIEYTHLRLYAKDKKFSRK